MIITSTGEIIEGAEADIQLPQAVRREILPSFQIIVVWYFQPTFLASVVISAQTLFLPFLFLSKGILRHNLPVGLVQ